MIGPTRTAPEWAAIDALRRCGSMKQGEDGYWYGEPGRTFAPGSRVGVTPQLMADLVAAGAVEIMFGIAKLRPVPFGLT